jgi:hypothetical protein
MVVARLEPLLCPSCGAPQPVGDGDEVRCRACGTTSALPAPYKMLRDAHRVSADDAAQLDALCAEISRPPPAWERAAVVIGYGVGIVTLIVVAIGAILGAIGGMIVGEKLSLGDTLTMIVAGIGAFVCGLVSVPYAGEWVVAFVTTFDTDVAAEVVSAPHMQLTSDLAVAALLYFLGIVPIALAWRTSQGISSLEALQAKLAAKPAATPDAASSCRLCGAPLDVRPGALATRCIYCDAENLLTVPQAYAAKEKEAATAIDVQVRSAIAERDAAKLDDRRTMWALLAVGPVLAPIMCGAGWVMHKIFAA